MVAPVLAEDAVPLDRRMPRTALLFVSVRNVPELTRKFNESNSGKLVNDPAVKEFREQVVEKIEETAKEYEGKYGLTIKELLALPPGGDGLLGPDDQGQAGIRPRPGLRRRP